MDQVERSISPQELWLEAVQQPIRLHTLIQERLFFGFCVDQGSPLYLRVEGEQAVYVPTPDAHSPVYVMQADNTTWQLASSGEAELTSLLTMGRIEVLGSTVAEVVVWTPVIATLIQEIARRVETLQPPSKRSRRKNTTMRNSTNGASLPPVQTAEVDEAAAAVVQEQVVETSNVVETEEDHKGFWKWRHTRPFFAGLLTLLSGIFILLGPISLLEFSLLPGSNLWEGLTVGGLLIVMGLLQFFAPYYSTLVGGITIVLALVSLITSMGGLVIGMLLGLVGGALGVAWTAEPMPTQQVQREQTPAQTSEGLRG